MSASRDAYLRELREHLEVTSGGHCCVEAADQASDLIERMGALIERLAKALEPFARDRLSHEGETSDLVWRSPSEEMRRRAEAIDKRDAAIVEARLAVKAVLG